MARCPSCGNSDVAAGCLCSFEDSDSIVWSGSGSPTVPFVATANLDPDPDNALSSGVNGLLVEIPALILNPPRGRVYRTTTQAISSGVATAVIFTSEDYDTDAMHAASSTQVVAVNPGIYAVNFTLQWVGNTLTAGKNQAAILVNGAALTGGGGTSTSDTPSAGETTYLTTSCLVNLGAGDYFEGFAYQTSGSPKDVGSASMDWHYVGPTP